VFANARKCKWGYPRVEFVGHQVDETGLTFSREKLEGVLKVRKPETLKQLRSFIGLAPYFRDHVRDFVTFAHPLQQLLNRGFHTLGVKKGNLEILWTSVEELAFHVLKEAINDFLKLFFVRDEEENAIVLNTDASEFGIGAYCFQILEGIEHPIAFVSKELTEVEMKCNVTEKECYAIVYAF
jgi:hypothetical protein